MQKRNTYIIISHLYIEKMVSEYALIIYIVSGIVSSAIILGFVLSSKRISKGGSDKTSLVISEVKGVSVIKQKEPQQIDIATKYLNIPFNGLLKFAVNNEKYKSNWIK